MTITLRLTGSAGHNEAEITDPDVVAYLTSRPGEGAEVALALEALAVGVAVIEKISTKADLDFVRRQIDGLLTAFEKSIATLEADVAHDVEKILDPEDAKSLTARAISTLVDVRSDLEKTIGDHLNVDDVGSPLGRLIAAVKGFETRALEAFDPARSDSYTARLTAQLDETFAGDGRVADLVKSLLSLERDGSPLRAFLTEVRQAVDQVVAEVASIKAAEATREELSEKMTQKGVAFEDRLEETLNAIAGARGDQCERTGTTLEAGQSKAGDFVYTFGDVGLAITIEAKTKALGPKPTFDEAERVRRNRSTPMAIIVFDTDEKMHPSLGGWAIREGKLIATTADMIGPTLQIARLLTQRAADAGSEQVDPEAIRAGLERIEQAMKNVKAARRQITEIETAAGRVRSIVDDMVHDVTAAIADLAAEIEKAKVGSDDLAL